MSKMFMAITAGHENPGGAPEERANVDHHINPAFRRYPSEYVPVRLNSTTVYKHSTGLGR